MTHDRVGYSRGCRCDGCRSAQRDYMREYSRRRRAAGDPAGYEDAACEVCDAKYRRKIGRGIRTCSRACGVLYRYGPKEFRPDPARRRYVPKAERLAIHEADRWCCHICGDPVNRDAAAPHDLDSPVLDHVVALAVGGADDASNLRTAHFYCNAVKGAKSLADVV